MLPAPGDLILDFRGELLGFQLLQSVVHRVDHHIFRIHIRHPSGELKNVLHRDCIFFKKLAIYDFSTRLNVYKYTRFVIGNPSYPIMGFIMVLLFLRKNKIECNHTLKKITPFEILRKVRHKKNTTIAGSVFSSEDCLVNCGKSVVNSSIFAAQHSKKPLKFLTFPRASASSSGTAARPEWWGYR